MPLASRPRVHEDARPPLRPDTGDVSLSRLAGISDFLKRREKGGRSVALSRRFCADARRWAGASAFDC